MIRNNPEKRALIKHHTSIFKSLIIKILITKMNKSVHFFIYFSSNRLIFEPPNRKTLTYFQSLEVIYFKHNINVKVILQRLIPALLLLAVHGHQLSI
ncbi:hypothetical protein C1637_17905 [Chryseobacterium lactis]|uniref:Uncharacterized protein n=1 Tax=Chryseobacterium lactis TaxID=1241981 RepID=A0A3G6RHC4_CHRLC|nr:hypothetical protein EG342_13845 [Chryseobacterium lactis]AZB03273.1 hypothetical protein EG341_04710 [Chryseobacterium lactis]PNW12441.1 hypothetical protein C1637_17905 [Chryseobacterium lactis]